MAGYRDLRVWRDSKDLSVDIYKLTRGGEWDRDWGLRDQIRRAAVSVPSNIAEGEARNSQKDSIRFFRYSQGSLAELSTQLEIAWEIEYIEESAHSKLQDVIVGVQRSIGALIKKRTESI